MAAQTDLSVHDSDYAPVTASNPAAARRSSCVSQDQIVDPMDFRELRATPLAQKTLGRMLHPFHRFAQTWISLFGHVRYGGCHSEILEEWKPSFHRNAAMDSIFHSIQNVMAKQNGLESVLAR